MLLAGLHLDERSRQPEVDDLDGTVVALVQQQEVLGLEVAVADLVVVAVVDGLRDLLEDVAGLGLAEVALADDFVEQFSSLADP